MWEAKDIRSILFVAMMFPYSEDASWAAPQDLLGTSRQEIRFALLENVKSETVVVFDIFLVGILHFQENVKCNLEKCQMGAFDIYFGCKSFFNGYYLTLFLVVFYTFGKMSNGSV